MLCLRHSQTMKFYLLWIEQDLLGEWSFCKLTGNNMRADRKLSICCASHAEALHLMNDLEYKLRQKGFLYFDSPKELDKYNAV